MNQFGIVALATALIARATLGGVFDDAKAWWKFDNGGADGAVVTPSEIHDARNANQAVPTAVYGASGGPLWAHMTVRLPHQRKSVESTALYLPGNTNSSTQYYPANALFTGLQMHGDNITIVARVRLSGESVCAADCILWNNAFNWSGNYGSAFGFIKSASAIGDGTAFFPYMFAGNNSFGNGANDKQLALKLGEWYDVAYIYQVETVDETRYDVVTYVVAGDSGVRTQTIRKTSQRATTASNTSGRLGVMNEHKNWISYNTTISSNTNDNFKDFSGWVHQLALWERSLTLDEVLEAFGRPPATADARDVWSDVANWWRFDRDLNGDGKVQVDEIRDVRHWHTMTECGAVAGNQYGPQGGPIWTNVNVYLPGQGITVRSDCLYLPITTNLYENDSGETILQSFPTALALPNATRAGSYTVLARICPEQPVGCITGHDAYFYNNGLHWGNWSGAEFGIRPDTAANGNIFYPRICIAHSWYSASSLTMRTNTWYDIAFSVKDNGFDADGNALTDSLLIAVQDIEFGFRTYEQNISTNAYTTFAAWWGDVNLGGQGRYTGLSDYYNLTTKKDLSGGNSGKSFRGMIHQLAIWDRALTKEEIGAAFSHPSSMVMGVGTADGSSGEFATSEGSYDYVAGEDWHAMNGVLDVSHPDLTIRFTPDTNNLELVHLLHIKTAAVGQGDGEEARLALRLNGTSLASAKEVGAYDDLFCIVPKNALVKGENVLRISYTGGTAANLALDSVRIGGSWQLGVEDARDYEFVREGSGRSNDYIVGNRAMTNVVRSLVSSSTTKKKLIFHVPSELAANHTSTFVARQANRGGTEGYDFRVMLNGTEKFRTPDGGMKNGQDAAFEIEKGELLAGWNTIEFEFLGAGWITFDFFRLSISDYNPGTFFFVR